MIFTSIENRYNIKIESIDDNSFKFELEDLHENLIYEKNVFEDDLKNESIKEIQKYILFIQRCFLQKENYIFKIEFFEESYLLHSFKKCKIFFKYEIDNIININSELILDERIEEDTQKEDRLLEHKIEELNKTIEDLNIQLENKNRIIQNYESEFDLPEVLSKTEFLKIVNENNLKKKNFPHCTPEHINNLLSKFKEFINCDNDYIVFYYQKIVNQKMHFIVTKNGFILQYCENYTDNGFGRGANIYQHCFQISKKNRLNKDKVYLLKILGDLYFQNIDNMFHGYSEPTGPRIIYAQQFYHNVLMKLP
jgi:hypothetical protein